MTEAIYEQLQASTDPWYCMRCLAVKGNKISWGNMEGEEKITAAIKQTYKGITTWKKNLFLLPRGKAGTDLIVELTRLLSLFTDDTKWKRVALSLAFIFVPLMMQKPSKKSKAKENSKYLAKRLILWRDGKIDALIAEGKEVQKNLKEQFKKKTELKEQALS